jgi:hypothetical protein
MSEWISHLSHPRYVLDFSAEMVSWFILFLCNAVYGHAPHTTNVFDYHRRRPLAKSFVVWTWLWCVSLLFSLSLSAPLLNSHPFYLSGARKRACIVCCCGIQCTYCRRSCIVYEVCGYLQRHAFRDSVCNAFIEFLSIMVSFTLFKLQCPDACIMPLFFIFVCWVCGLEPLFR